MTTTTIHIGLSVRGAIRNRMYLKKTSGSLVGCCTDTKTGRKLTSDEILTMLMDCLQEGKEIIPIGDECDNWDWKHGCRGHQVPK